MMSLPSQSAPRCWYYQASTLTNPWGPPIWRGGDEYGRRTIVFQAPMLGALVIARGQPKPCPECETTGMEFSGAYEYDGGRLYTGNTICPECGGLGYEL